MNTLSWFSHFPGTSDGKKGSKIEFLIFRQIYILALCSKSRDGPGNPLDITFLYFFGNLIFLGIINWEKLLAGEDFKTVCILGPYSSPPWPRLSYIGQLISRLKRPGTWSLKTKKAPRAKNFVEFIPYGPIYGFGKLNYLESLRFIRIWKSSFPDARIHFSGFSRIFLREKDYLYLLSQGRCYFGI